MEALFGLISRGIGAVLPWKRPPSAPINLYGRRATSLEALETEARAYVKSRKTTKGGFSQAWNGFWKKTLPYLLGKESQRPVLSLISLLVRLSIAIGGPIFVVISRRAVLCTTTTPNSGIEEVVSIFHGITPLDIALGLGALIFLGIPKAIDQFKHLKRPPDSHPQWRVFAAAIDKLPTINVASDPFKGRAALTHALAALRMDMASMVGEENGKRIVEVTLLQYRDAEGKMMEATARTAAKDPLNRPRDSRLFLANYVGRGGRWFAEHDFLSPTCPFKPQRITVPGGEAVDYRTVLFMPIFTSEVPGAEAGEVEAVDYCLGVICIQCTKPYRFWRWGDHKRTNGTGFGNVAIERATPYIAVIQKLLEQTANRVKVEAT